MVFFAPRVLRKGQSNPPCEFFRKPHRTRKLTYLRHHLLFGRGQQIVFVENGGVVDEEINMTGFSPCGIYQLAAFLLSAEARFDRKCLNPLLSSQP